ncbi:MAG: hypothetical protein ACR2MX_03995 [Cyclobacteriaceae bacterium]
MKIYGLIMGLFLFAFTANAQDTYNKGEITLKNGKTQEGYVLINYSYPQRFQSSVTYISESAYKKFKKSGKVKGKQKKTLKPKDIQGFSLENGMVAKTVQYTDLSSKGVGMIPKKLILEQIADGKIDMYKMYSKTTGKISLAIADARRAGELADYITSNFQLLVQKDTKNPKNVAVLNILKLIGDNQEVKENYDNNVYGLRDQFSQPLKEGKLVTKRYEEAFLKMLNAYNNG